MAPTYKVELSKIIRLISGLKSAEWWQLLGETTPQGSSTEGESGPKIRTKGVVDGQQVNIPVLPLVGTEGRRRLR